MCCYLLLLLLVSVTDAKQARLQELLDASEMLADMPSLVDPTWLSAGMQNSVAWSGTAAVPLPLISRATHPPGATKRALHS
jgi:hypothetical protein